MRKIGKLYLSGFLLYCEDSSQGNSAVAFIDRLDFDCFYINSNLQKGEYSQWLEMVLIMMEFMEH